MCTASATHIFSRVEALPQVLPTHRWRYKKPELHQRPEPVMELLLADKDESPEVSFTKGLDKDNIRGALWRRWGPCNGGVEAHTSSYYRVCAWAKTGPRPHAPETGRGHISLIQALDLLMMGSASFHQLFCPRQVQYTTVYAQVHSISTAQCVARVPYVEASSPTGTGGEIQQQLHEHTKGDTGDHVHRISNPHLQRGGGFATGAAYKQVEVQEARVFIRGQSQGRSCFWQTKMAASVALDSSALSAASPSVNLAAPPAAGQDCTVPLGCEALSL
ncbi:hypothetical protein NDU88_005825 [Pleurodeles waltl]|uniref:Uncharacterized protein n=1 Tax=Pleurodeles waltl TaxID=8319 RepID=A0AAV7L602_PLEWA|nr:hypothetical protein NDU88_005825 [Pleurodeles waltl]